jgi:farnesyl-diphosphate farnesyltransferase
MQDLKQFSGSDTSGRVEASASSIQALRTPKELDDYTYMVAGCVGEFWTRICRAHLFPKAELDDHALINDGIRFGKGLQLVNILRDLPSDLRNGRCYIPDVELSEIGLSPADLLSRDSYDKFKALHNRWLALAEQHLSTGWRYTNKLPWTQVRVRLACAWPVLIGFETLKLLKANNVLDHSKRLKVPRSWVKRMMLKSILLYPFPSAWRGLAPK